MKEKRGDTEGKLNKNLQKRGEAKLIAKYTVFFLYEGCVLFARRNKKKREKATRDYKISRLEYRLFSLILMFLCM